jgi:hypothetical protein
MGFRLPIRVVLLSMLVGLVGVSSAGASLNRWAFVTDPSGMAPTQVRFAPADSSVMWMVDDFGTFRSTDRGASWSNRINAPCLDYSALAPDPTTADAADVACQSGIYRISGGGSTVTQLSGPLGVGGRIWELAIPADQPSTIYAAVDPSANGVYQSTDAGATWQPMPVPPAMSVVVAPSDWQVVYAGTTAGVVRTTDGGATWSSPAGPIEAMVAVDSLDPSVAFAAPYNAPGTVSVTTDGGSSWTATTDGPTHVQQLTTVGGVVYAAATSGTWRSSDQGSTWRSTGLVLGIGQAAVSLAVDPADNADVFAGIQDLGLWRVEFDNTLPDGASIYWASAPTAVTDITPTSATLNGTVAAIPPGSNSAFFGFEWGETTTYGHVGTLHQIPTPAGTLSEQAISQQLTDLTPNTTYHFRLDGFFQFGSVSTNGDSTDLTFTTPPVTLPSSTAPAIEFTTGRLPHGRLPARLAWSATPGTYPTCATRLQRSRAAGWRTLPLATSTSTEADIHLRPGWAKRSFRARAIDCNGGRGPWNTGSVAVPMLQDWGRRWSWSKAWQTVPDPARAKGSVHIATRTGASATVQLRGRSISLIALVGPHMGTVVVTVDGETFSRINLHAASLGRRAVFARTFAQPGSHTLRIQVARGRVAIDAVAAARRMT